MFFSRGDTTEYPHLLCLFLSEALEQTFFETENEILVSFSFVFPSTKAVYSNKLGEFVLRPDLIM